LIKKIRGHVATLGVAVAAAVALPLFASPAWAGSDQTPPHLQDASGNFIESGPLASTQTFKIILPTGAACSLPTSPNGYHVGSFLANTSAGDPATFTYGAGGPLNGGFGLSNTVGTAYQNVSTNTDATVNPGPTFSLRKLFTLYVQGGQPANGGAGQLYSGTWNMGISCTDANSPANADNVWNIPVTFTDVSTSVDPNGFQWQVTPGTSLPETPYAIALPLSAVALGGGAFLVLRRRRRGTTPTAA
jgi:hypothetical protein